MRKLGTRRKTAPPAARSAGFSLVEVLISVLILSFGLLGIVGLQVGALQGNRDARQQSIATGLARELAEMIRGNKDVAQASTAADNPFLGDFSGTGLRPAQTSDCLVPGHSCPVDAANPVAGQRDVARAEMTDWLVRVEEQLPGARVAVCFDAAPYDAQGLARWSCTAGSTDSLVLKIGWSRASTDRSGGNSVPVDQATRPALVLPVTPGSSV